MVHKIENGVSKKRATLIITIFGTVNSGRMAKALQGLLSEKTPKITFR